MIDSKFSVNISNLGRTVPSLYLTLFFSLPFTAISLRKDSKVQLHNARGQRLNRVSLGRCFGAVQGSFVLKQRQKSFISASRGLGSLAPGMVVASFIFIYHMSNVNLTS